MDIRTLKQMAEDANNRKDRATESAIRAAMREIEYLRNRNLEYASEVEHLKRLNMDANRKLENINRAWELCARWPDTADDIRRIELAISDQEM